MAKIDPTSLFTELRGTVGGLTFSKNKSGFFVKRKYAGLPTQRPAPVAIRTAFREASVYWQSVKMNLVTHPTKGPIPVMEWWNDFAALPENSKIDVFGGTYKASGYNWFQTYAVLQSLEAKAPMMLPPTDAIPGVWPNFTVRFFHTGAGTLSDFSSTTTSTAQQTRPWITLRLQYHTGEQAVIPPFFFARTFPYITPASSAPFQTQLENVFGAVPDGTRCYFAVRFRRSNGRISAPVLFSLVSGASHLHVSA